MKAIREQVIRHYPLWRLAVLLLAISALLPLELVWCVTGDQHPPQIEPALHGACLSGVRAGCCEDGAIDVAQNSAGPLALGLADHAAGHDPCCSCTDLHAGRAADAAGSPVAAKAPGLTACGVLFILDGQSATDPAAGVSARAAGLTSPPPLALRLCAATILLI